MSEAMACGMTVVAYDNPVLRENARAYPFITWFKTEEQLMFRLDEAFKQWRDEIAAVDVFAWKHSIKKIEEALATL